MAEYIECRDCTSPDCKGCNLKNLETMLKSGKFDCLMNGNRCINPNADVSTVVRCRDCIGKSTWYNDVEYGCAICGMSGMYPKSENGYCSYGLRREND